MKQQFFLNKLTPLLIVAFAGLIIPIFVVGTVKADRASDFCEERIPVSNSETAGALASCIQAARAAERNCNDTFVEGTQDWQQCIDNYYEGVRGQSSGTPPSGEGEKDLEAVLGGDKDCSADVLTSENCGIVGYLVLAINVMSALAGMAIVFSIMFAGFQYMTARDNPGQIQQARTRIIWAISALLIFIFTYAILNFLVPGGVL